MEISFVVGLVGAGVLVVGAAWPDKKVKHPVKSVKNWLFALGGLCMLVYSILNYLAGGPVFFIFLQALINVASLLMMINIRDKYDVPIISVLALGLIGWSLYLFEGYNTVFFVIGLAGLGMGYAMDTATVRRNISLLIGSVLVAVFSYLESSWIFFWLNVFFALFSGYYAWKLKTAR